jgi:peptidoglycan/xylan/chitin deacetylase (PgdA/CDA1 family)
VQETMDGMRRFAQWVWVRVLYLTGALWWAKRELQRQGAIIVLTLHRVLEDECFSQTDSLPNIVVRKSTFRRLIRYVTENYEAVDVLKALPGKSSARLRVAFTFDDGWQDNFEHAMPELQAHSVPVTIFLCTGLMGRKAPFWPEQIRGTLYESLRRSYGKRAGRLVEALIESLKYGSAEARASHLDLLLQQTNGKPTEFYACDSTLNWDQIIEMRRLGIAFGSHTHTHQILTSVKLDAAKSEACDSKAAIEAKLNESCETFAYPNGNWSPQIRDLVAESGYRLAFTTDRRAWVPGTDRLAIPRSNVQEEDLVGLTGRFSAAMFDYATSWKVWQSLRRSQKRAALKARAVTAPIAGEIR